MIMRMAVVFPAPLGPMSPYSAPRGTARSRWSTASVLPNRVVTAFSRTAALMLETVLEVTAASLARRGSAGCPGSRARGGCCGL